MSGGVTDEPLTLVKVAPEHDDLVVGPERAGQEAAGVQSLDPLAVEAVGLGPALDGPGLTRVDQDDLEAAAIEQFVEGDPVDAGGLHGDAPDAEAGQPVGQSVQVGGEGGEASDGAGVAAGWDRDPVLGRSDVDAGGIGLDDGEVGGTGLGDFWLVNGHGVLQTGVVWEHDRRGHRRHRSGSLSNGVTSCGVPPVG